VGYDLLKFETKGEEVAKPVKAARPKALRRSMMKPLKRYSILKGEESVEAADGSLVTNEESNINSNKRM
jgi:hypothetical protein